MNNGEVDKQNSSERKDIGWPVMVLAHNEEGHIAACLDSIFLADPEASFDVYVMANGCSDQTEGIVREYQRRNEYVNLISIGTADKCNAWNIFIHDIVPDRCPDRSVYFFVDGDAQFKKRSFSAMAQVLEQEPYANAVGAPPVSGRSMNWDASEIVKNRGLVANLYALRGKFVDRLRKKRVRIPAKLEGDDGLIGALVKWDLNPTLPMDNRRIAPCPEAGFSFESLNPAHLSDWVTYYKRMVRYGRRSYEFALLRTGLKEKGLECLPADITELYGEADKLRIEWSGVYSITNWIALLEMRRIADRMRMVNNSD